MMHLKAILIRDDDINFFTDIKRFQKVHRILIQNRIPFNVAVIPKVRADVPAVQTGYEGFIPVRYQGKPDSYSVSENQDLVSFLRANPFIEISQHGFSHEKTEQGLPEFTDENFNALVRRLDAGARILKSAFGAKPSFFVPPYDTVSKTALDAIRKRYEGISLSLISHSLLPMKIWPQFLIRKKMKKYLLNWKRFHILQVPGLDYSFLNTGTPTHPIDDMFSSANDYLVLSLHSWNFFTPEGRLKSEMFARWEQKLSELIFEKRMRFMTFSEL